MAEQKQLHHITVKSDRLARAIDDLYVALKKSFDQERKFNDPTLKHYEVHERLLARALNHPETKKEIKELIAAGFLPDHGLK